jgi:steroid 5-alpha reductase family enzyme
VGELLLTTLGISLVIQAALFAVAATLKTDKVTDLSYGLTFVLIAVWLPASTGLQTMPALLVSAMVVLWGIRLAGYLFYRILTIGKDSRFDGIREHFWPFFKFWFGQGVAVWVILLPVTLWFARPGGWNLVMAAGLLVWAVGLVIETVADAQKFAAKTAPGGRGRWVETGLWRHARYPNYFGEMLCWWGVYVFVAPDLGLWNLVGVLGPVAITFILLKVTGIPTLEKSAREKWGDDPEYQAYVRRTRVLVPLRRG